MSPVYKQIYYPYSFNTPTLHTNITLKVNVIVIFISDTVIQLSL